MPTNKEKLMNNKNDSAASGEPVAGEHDNIQRVQLPAVSEHSRRRGWWGIGAAAFVAAFALVVFVGDARGQLAGVQIIPLAQGSSPDKNVVLHIKGPSDVLQADLIFQPGGQTGWHTHPGPVVVVIKSGALTEIHENGCTTVHPAGSVFFEEADVVHNAINQTGGVTEVFATFMSPAGAPPLIPAGNPGGVCRDRDPD
jgi:quercetin dioxygenase-like cupin family protein